MNNRFDTCIGFVLRHETEHNADGSVKVERNPKDPGGVTKYGIDQRDHPNVNVAALTLHQATEIYRRDIWEKCNCERLKIPWDLAVFDSCVNPGFKSARFLQQVVGTTIDGHIGPVTIAKVNGASIDQLFDFLHLREAYYRGLPERLKEEFLSGWLNRLADLRGAVIKPAPGASLLARSDPSSIISKAASGVVA